MKISLIIPAHNEEKYLGRCLKSVTEHAKDLFEIIVIDNASKDKTSEVAKAFPGVRVVLESKKGLTKARQRGLLEAKGDILAYIDADTYVSENWFSVIKREFAKNKNLACLSGPYKYYDIPKLHQIFVSVYWYFGYITYLFTNYMIVGGNFAIRKDVIEKMGGFDTTIEFYGEDTNVARRAKEHGKVKFDFDFFIHTSGRRFAGQGLANTAWVYVINFFSEVFRHKPITKEYTDIR
ncbi:MAG: glycosyltransferase family 2 protein [bacterium]